MSTQIRPLLEWRTSMRPEDVLAAAKRFFARRNTIYSAFVEKEGPNYVTMRGQGGEELALAAVVDGNSTRVTGSTYIFDFPLQRFFSTLPPAPESVE